MQVHSGRFLKTTVVRVNLGVSLLNEMKLKLTILLRCKIYNLWDNIQFLGVKLRRFAYS